MAVLLTLHFTLPPDHEARPQIAGGFIWAVVLFAAMLEMRRGLDTERRDGTLDGLRQAPLDPTVLYLAKVTSSVLVLAALQVILVPVATLFFGGRVAGVPAALAVGIAGSIGLIAWGTLFATIAGHARSGEVLLPVLLFPLVVPQTIAVVRLLSEFLGPADPVGLATGLVLIGAFNLLSLGTSILLFDYVLSE